MILLPIGHEQSGTRRLPWITFGVMILCVATFLLTGRAGLVARDDVETGQDVMEAVRYYLEHPYLELDPEFEKFVFPDGTKSEEFREAFGAFLDAAGAPPMTAGVREAEQETLDRLVEAARRSVGEHPLNKWGLTPNAMRPVTLVTHMFLHVGWMHLIGNLLILYLAGPFIEDVWGRPLYAGFYLASGIVAALAFIAPNPDSGVPLVGASGAIAGVMGAFLVRYSTTRIRFFYMLGLFWRGTFDAPAWIMLPMWFAQQAFMTLLVKDAGDSGGVAYLAHIGGFAFGAGVALALRHFRIEERYLEPAIDRKVAQTVVDNGAVERALAAQEAGRPEEALELLLAEARRSPANQDAALACWSVAAELGRAPEAAPFLLRLIQHELRRGETDLALEHWEEVEPHLAPDAVDGSLLLKIADAQASSRRSDGAVATLRRALLQASVGKNAALAWKTAQTAEPLDARIARAAARLALDEPGLDPEARSLARALVQRLVDAGARSSVALG